MKTVAIHCRYTTHHFAIKKVIHGFISNLDEFNLDLNYIIFVNRNNLGDFLIYKNLKIIILPINSDNSILNHLFNIFILPFYLFYFNISVIVFPQISFFIFTGKRTVTFIHDLIEYKIRNQSWRKYIVRRIFFPYIAKISDVIITVSENSKSDIINLLGVNKCKVHVAYDGVDHIRKFTNISQEESYDFLIKKYGYAHFFLYVGYLSLPQKNLINLIDAYYKFYCKKSKSSPHLFLVGPLGKDSEKIFQRINDLNIGNRIKYLGTVGEYELSCLYKVANIFCFPSLYEGFGMPVAEAMSSGCPVITSNVSSLPEVVGNTGVLVNPLSVEEIYLAMVFLYDNPDNAKRLILLAKERAKQFSWKTFSETVVKSF